MTKLQITLTDQEAVILASYGQKLGYNLTKITKYIISKATEDILQKTQIPVYTMSEELEKLGLDALTEHQKGQTKQIVDIDKYFNNL